MPDNKFIQVYARMWVVLFIWRTVVNTINHCIWTILEWVKAALHEPALGNQGSPSRD